MWYQVERQLKTVQHDVIWYQEDVQCKGVMSPEVNDLSRSHTASEGQTISGVNVTRKLCLLTKRTRGF
jgi:hypothetical protein